jgi:hypothetical protein
MRLTARRIRAINHCLARNGSIICNSSDAPVRRLQEAPKPPSPTLKIVAVPRQKAA